MCVCTLAEGGAVMKGGKRPNVKKAMFRYTAGAVAPSKRKVSAASLKVYFCFVFPLFSLFCGVAGINSTRGEGWWAGRELAATAALLCHATSRRQ